MKMPNWILCSARSRTRPAAARLMRWRVAIAPEHESPVTVNFEPSGGGTDLTLLHEQFFDAGERDAHEQGWNNALAKIDAVIAAP